MIPKVAWLNIWRNKLRSMVVIVSIILGVWAGLFVLALSKGLNDQRTESMIKTSISHIQIHDPEFITDQKVGNTLGEHEKELHILLDTLKDVEAYTFRTRINGMVSSAVGGFGANVVGVDPDMERRVTSIDDNIVQGNYFDSSRFSNPAVLGKALVDKLGLELHSKVVLRFQGVDGDMVAGAFRICGIFESLSSTYDRSHLFIRQEDVMRSMGVDQPVHHEVALLATDRSKVDKVEKTIEANTPGLKARTWKEISPELGYADELMSQMMYIFIGIIMLALAFGIVNTMLMAVLERKRELGMLMAIGMNRVRVFFMILLETVYLSILSGPIGIFLSYISIEYFKKVGIDLSIVGEGLRSLAVGSIVYPDLDVGFYWNISLIVVLTAILASIYPARKALKLKPAEAVRAV